MFLFTFSPETARMCSNMASEDFRYNRGSYSLRPLHHRLDNHLGLFGCFVYIFVTVVHPYPQSSPMGWPCAIKTIRLSQAIFG
jgi:hypothetical protein